MIFLLLVNIMSLLFCNNCSLVRCTSVQSEFILDITYSLLNAVVHLLYFSSSSSSLTPGTSLRGSTPFKNFTRTPINPPGSRHHSSSVTSGTSGPSVLVGKFS